MTNLIRAIIAVGVLSVALQIKPQTSEETKRDTATLEKPVAEERRVRVIE